LFLPTGLKPLFRGDLLGENRKSLSPSPPSLPAPARKLFERFPMGAEHDKRGYRDLLVDVFTTIQPKDTLEAVWTRKSST
jgi:hypothetical protein